MKKSFYIILVILVLLSAALCGCAKTVPKYQVEYTELETYDIPFDIENRILLVIKSRADLEKAASIKDARYPDDSNAYFTLDNLDKYDNEYFKTHSIIMYSWKKAYRRYGLEINLECDNVTLYFSTKPYGSSQPVYVHPVGEEPKLVSAVINDYMITFLEVEKEKVANVKTIEEISSHGVILC